MAGYTNIPGDGKEPRVIEEACQLWTIAGRRWSDKEMGLLNRIQLDGP